MKNPTRKKRLSRKEQKARKKQRHNKKEQEETPAAGEQVSTAAVAQPPNTISLDSFQGSYSPIPIPNSFADGASGPQSLGKWFPRAKIIKSRITYSNDHRAAAATGATIAPKASILLFYQYASPSWPESKVSQLILYLTKVAEKRILGGRIRIAPEGVNATVSSVDGEDYASARETLRHFCLDLQRFDPHVFKDTDFKFIDDVQPDRHFKDLKLLPVKELVFYGIDDQQAPLEKGGIHLDPKDFHEKLQADPTETVVIDVRNHYEAAIGRFDGQQQNGGAEYIDPLMRKSTDFPAFLAKPETQERLKNKNVLMFCTGGVRCERASAYLNQQMGSDVKGVYQLQGGIERYLQAFPDGGHWRGKNFVFDKREAISADNREGDGGVVRRRKKSDVGEGTEAKCCVCTAPWDRYVGKKKCQTCGVPVLMCDSCMSKKKDISQQLVRCPLCVEEKITVPVAAVEYTDNGVSGRLSLEAAESEDRPLHDDSKLKAASSVLKWGGGHASEKKQRRRLKRKPCKFGADCTRPDCFFAHPKKNEVAS
jgi:predicted sulfurtransferase